MPPTGLSNSTRVYGTVPMGVGSPILLTVPFALMSAVIPISAEPAGGTGFGPTAGETLPVTGFEALGGA